MSSRPLSLAAGTLPPGTPAVEAIRAGATAGFDAVGLRPGETALGPGDSSAVRRAAEDAGVQILDVEVVRIGSTSPLITARIIEYAAEVGAAHVLVVSDAVSPAATVAGFGEVCRRAEGSGIRPVLEFMRFTAVPDLATASAVVTAVGDPLGGVLVDALHLCRSGGRASDVAALPPSVVPYVQVCDAPREGPPGCAGMAEEARHSRLLPGEGQLSLTELALAVQHVPLSVEVQSDEGWRTRSVGDWAQAAFDATRQLVSRLHPGE